MGEQKKINDSVNSTELKIKSDSLSIGNAQNEFSCEPKSDQSINKKITSSQGLSNNEKLKNIAMLIVSEGNDIRAKKEADILLSAGYKVTFVGRKFGISSPEFGKDGRHDIIRVPAINTAKDISAIIGKNRNLFSFSERLLAWLLTIIFRLTSFKVTNTTSLIKVKGRGEKLIEKAKLKARHAIQIRSATGLSTSALLMFLGIVIKHPLKVIFSPILLLFFVIRLPFNAIDKIERYFGKRAISSWGALSSKNSAFGIFRSLSNIAVGKLVTLLQLILSEFPKKLVATVWSAISNLFGFPKRLLVKYLAPRVRTIFTLFSYFLYYVETKAAALSIDAELYHAHDLYMLQSAIKTARYAGKKAIYDAHELETDRHNNVNPRVKKAIFDQELKYGILADGVITVSKSIVDVLSTNIGRSDIVLVYNSPFVEIENRKLERDLRSDLNLPEDTPLVVFIGKLYNIHRHDHRINNLVEALAYIPGMHLAILGNKSGNAKAEILDWAKRHFVIDRVHLVPPVPYEELLGYVATADIGVNPMENKCLNTDFSMPNKVFEMSLAGLPVAQSNLKDSVNYLARYNMGIPMNANSARDMARAMMEAYASRNSMRPSKNALIHLRKTYGWAAQGSKLLDLYEKVLTE